MSIVLPQQQELGPQYAVVRLEGRTTSTVRDVTGPFASPSAADLYAVEQGWSAYQVAPIWLFGPATRPAAGSGRRHIRSCARRPGR